MHFRSRRDTPTIVSILNRLKTSNDPADWSVLWDLLGQVNDTKNVKVAAAITKFLEAKRGNRFSERNKVIGIISNHLTNKHLKIATASKPFTAFSDLFRHHNRFLKERIEKSEFELLQRINKQESIADYELEWVQDLLESIINTSLDDFFENASEKELLQHTYDILIENLLTMKPSMLTHKKSWKLRR